MQFRDLSRQYNHIKKLIDTNIQSVVEQTDFISGKPVELLEVTLANYVGVKHCITCGNGTDAITIALQAVLLKIPKEQWKNCAVFVPDFTFFSSGECPVALGLPTYFVDVKESTFNIAAEALEVEVKKVIEKGEHKPTFVIAVDLFGQPAEYGKLRTICDKYDMILLEDGAQGFGGSIDGKLACSFGDISTTSFFPAKPFGCYGDGGAIFTDNDGWSELCRSIAVHGKDMRKPNDPNAKYNNVRLGMNSRLDTIQAAVLLAKFDTFCNEELKAVNRVANWYGELLKGTTLTLPVVLPRYYSSWAQYAIKLSEADNRTRIQNRLKEKEIPTMIYYKKAMHKQDALKNSLPAKAECPVTKKLCETVLCLPIHPYLEKEEVEMICKEIKNVIK